MTNKSHREFNVKHTLKTTTPSLIVKNEAVLFCRYKFTSIYKSIKQRNKTTKFVEKYVVALSSSETDLNETRKTEKNTKTFKETPEGRKKENNSKALKDSHRDREKGENIKHSNFIAEHNTALPSLETDPGQLDSTMGFTPGLRRSLSAATLVSDSKVRKPVVFYS